MKKLSIILILSFFTFSTALYAQSLNSIGKAYDKASELLVEGDTSDAIKQFQKVADMTQGQGDIVACIKLTSEKKIYDLYVIEGQQAFAKKKFDAALSAYDMAGIYADSIGDPELKAQLKDYRLASYMGKADALMDVNKYEKASELYLEIIGMDYEYADAYYGLLLAYIKMDDVGSIVETEKEIQELNTDQGLKDKARKATASYYSAKSREALQKEEYNIASMMASQSLIYDNSDPEVYYNLACINNLKGEWANAEKSASRAIRMSKGSNPDYYYELAKAYEGTGKLEKACEAYSKVTGGDNQVKARNKRTQLNCN